MHTDLPDTGQRDGAGTAVVADPDRRQLALGVFVAQPKRRDVAGFFLEPRKPDPLACALTRAGIRPRRQALTEVDGGFLEHLLTHLVPAGQTRHRRLGNALTVDGEHPAR